MVKIDRKKIEKARELRAMGFTYDQVAQQVGISKFAVHKHCSDVAVEDCEVDDYKRKMSFEQQYDWTVAVNRIRKYCRKKPLPMPEFRAQVPGR